MSQSLKLIYASNEYEFYINHALIFVGGDHFSKRELHKILKRYAAFGTYSPVEVELFGEVGIEIEYEGKALSKRENSFIFIDNLHDIVRHFEYKRNSLLYESLELLKEDYQINQVIHKINDDLIAVESKLNRFIGLDNNKISLNLKELLLEDVLKSLLDINHIYNETEIPSYFIKLEDTLDTFISLLKNNIQNSSKTHWIILNSPESIFRSEVFYQFYKKLENISKETDRLKILIFHYRASPYYDLDDIESVVLACDGLEQLPDIDTFYKSIERHYPCELKETKEDVLQTFFRICNFIGDRDRRYYYLTHKDMILLYVLRDILNDDSSFEVKSNKLSLLEENYLKSKGFEL